MGGQSGRDVLGDLLTGLGEMIFGSDPQADARAQAQAAIRAQEQRLTEFRRIAEDGRFPPAIDCGNGTQIRFNPLNRFVHMHRPGWQNTDGSSDWRIINQDQIQALPQQARDQLHYQRIAPRELLDRVRNGPLTGRW